jgi:hypothetical protein
LDLKTSIHKKKYCRNNFFFKTSKWRGNSKWRHQLLFYTFGSYIGRHLDLIRHHDQFVLTTNHKYVMRLSSRRCFHPVDPLLQKLLVFFILCIVDIAKLHAIDVVFHPLEHFTRSFHMSLFCGPKNSMRSASFYRSPDTIHSSFPMRSGEKLPLHFDVFMVFFMVSLISAVKLVFIVAHYPVGKVITFSTVRKFLT